MTNIHETAIISSNVKIGDNCMIAGQVGFAGSTKVGNNVSIGSNSTLLPVNITNNVVIGAGSVVTKNINKSGTYVGNPAKRIK